MTGGESIQGGCNDSNDVTFRLASGNVGVMAATNEVVAAADSG